MYVHNCFSFLQNGYCSFALRISSWARWTLYSLWRSHVLSHPFTSCQPEWSQVIHFFHLSVSLISWTINLETNKVYRIFFIGRNEKYVLIFCIACSTVYAYNLGKIQLQAFFMGFLKKICIGYWPDFNQTKIVNVFYILKINNIVSFVRLLLSWWGQLLPRYLLTLQKQIADREA